MASLEFSFLPIFEPNKQYTIPATLSVKKKLKNVKSIALSLMEKEEVTFIHRIYIEEAKDKHLLYSLNLSRFVTPDGCILPGQHEFTISIDTSSWHCAPSFPRTTINEYGTFVILNLNGFFYYPMKIISMLRKIYFQLYIRRGLLARDINKKIIVQVKELENENFDVLNVPDICPKLHSLEAFPASVSLKFDQRKLLPGSKICFELTATNGFISQSLKIENVKIVQTYFFETFNQNKCYKEKVKVGPRKIQKIAPNMTSVVRITGKLPKKWTKSIETPRFTRHYCVEFVLKSKKSFQKYRVSFQIVEV